MEETTCAVREFCRHGRKRLRPKSRCDKANGESVNGGGSRRKRRFPASLGKAIGRLERAFVEVLHVHKGDAGCCFANARECVHALQLACKSCGKRAAGGSESEGAYRTCRGS